MTQGGGPQNLSDLLDELDKAADGNGAKVSVDEILDTVGRRSFGPLLLLSGLLGMTPVAAVPGAPSILALITFLVAIQLLFGRDSAWLPKFVLKLHVKAERVKKAVRVARKPAKFADRIVKPRLHALTGGFGDRAAALVCVVLAAATPPLELLPFVAFFPAAAVAVFGLGLIARDGLLVLIGFLIAGGVAAFAAWRLLF